MIAALLVCTAAGMWNGMLVSRVRMQPIIATLILFVAGRGIAMLFTNSLQLWLYAKPFAILGQGYVLGLPFDIYIVAFVLLLTFIFTRRTAIGMFIEAVGINPTAARFSGINAKNIIFWVYAFSGLCAGIAGLIVCSTVMNADGNNAGRLFELDAILAVVLGGTSLNGGKFYLVGSIVGALIIQTLTTTIYAFGVPVRCCPGRQGVRRVGRLPAAVPEVPLEDRAGCSSEGRRRHEKETPRQLPEPSRPGHPRHCSSSCSGWARSHFPDSSRFRTFSISSSTTPISLSLPWG